MTKEINHNFVVFIIRLTLLLYIVASTGLIPTFGDELLRGPQAERSGRDERSEGFRGRTACARRR